MAKTGINIEVSNTTFAGVPKVNENSILICISSMEDDQDTTEIEVADELIKVTSYEDFEVKSSSAGYDPIQKRQVKDYFQPTPNINNNGKTLWVIRGLAHISVFDTPEINIVNLKEFIVDAVAGTVENGFENRPRQIILSLDNNFIQEISASGSSLEKSLGTNIVTLFNEAIKGLYQEGFATVGIMPTYCGVSVKYEENPGLSVQDLSKLNAPFVSVCCVASTRTWAADVGRVAGYLVNKSVGESIGDTSTEAFANEMYLITTQTYAMVSGAYGESFPVSTLPKNVIDELGERQWLFTRTRPPRNGLWWNDGATCADPATGLSTLEMGRTIASITDDLREFFSYYINTRVPVSDNGDIQPTYKQVVLDSAFAQVIQPYIDSGDISNARIELKAVNNNMVESRTWEVKLSILPAPTLRWVDAYVFYVKTLE